MPSGSRLQSGEESTVHCSAARKPPLVKADMIAVHRALFVSAQCTGSGGPYLSFASAARSLCLLFLNQLLT